MLKILTTESAMAQLSWSLQTRFGCGPVAGERVFENDLLPVLLRKQVPAVIRQRDSQGAQATIGGTQFSV